MTINTYKFSYEVSSNSKGLVNDNYVEKCKNYIAEKSGNPSFVLPKYFRCSVIYSPKEEINPERWRVEWGEKRNKLENGEVVGGSIEKTVRSSYYERYIYNRRDTPLESPETQISDKYGLDFVESEGGFIVSKYDKKYYNWETLSSKTFLCSAIVTYSDEDPRAGDEYVEPEPRKKIYLVNLDFGYRRSRRKNNNRRQYRRRY